MEKILLKDTTNIDVETKDIMVSGLDEVNTSFLPLNINITNCDFILSSAIVNKRNTEILGVVLVSTVYLDCFNGENGYFILGCGIVNNIKDDVRKTITNMLITHIKSLFQFGRKDDGSFAIDYFCLQPNTKEECEEIKIEYGMTKHTYQDCTILSKHINNGITIDLSFLKRYLK